MASIPIAPVPANRSSTRASVTGSPYECARILNSASRNRSLVGRTESDFGLAIGRERSLPPTTRIILVSTGASRPSGRAGLPYVCRVHSDGLRPCRTFEVCGFRAAGPDAAAAKAAAVHRRPRAHRNLHWTRRQSAHPILCAARKFRLLYRSVVDGSEVERSERDTDQPVHLQAQRFKNLAYLAVLALANGEGQPDIRALFAVERRFNRTVVYSVDGDAVLQTIERLLADAAQCTHAIPAQPAGCRQFQHACQTTVIGEQQQTLGVDVEPSDADDPRK